MRYFGIPINKFSGGFKFGTLLVISFWHHWITRGLTERKVEGMEDLVSLNLEEIEKPLGYGYDAGTNILFWVESN